MYYSWDCPDLGTTLYAAEFTANPDSQENGALSMVDRAMGFDIITPYYTDIADALAVGTTYTTGVIRLARLNVAGALSNDYFMLSITASGSNQTVTVTLGYGSGSSYTYSTSTTLSAADFMALPAIKRHIFIVYKRNRSSYNYEGMPNYSGGTEIKVIFGAVKKQVGTWHQSSSTYPYGHMSYATVDTGLLSDIPGGTIPCAVNNEESRSQQSELRGFAWDVANMLMSGYSGGSSWVMPTDYEGNNDQGDDPYDKDPNENDPGGPSKPGGGNGSHEPHYDPIPVPPLPTIGPNSAGFVYMLRMDTTTMQTFAADLVRPSWWEALKAFFADPMDFICGIMIVPYQPDSNRNITPRFGENYMLNSFPQVSQQYKKIDCGSILVDKYFGSCFDNNPYTKLLIWLPYIGYRELDPDECVGKSIHVIYHCDCMTGDCVAYISTEAGEYGPVYSRVIAQFSGNCGVRVPFGTTSYDAAVAASVQLLGGAVGFAATGAKAGAGLAAGAIGASQLANSIQGSTIDSVNASKTATERSGTAGASAGYLSVQYPYLLKTVPQQSLPENYKDLEGYPSNIAGPLTRFSGFVGVETIDLNGIAATKSELDEILSLLRVGVYI